MVERMAGREVAYIGLNRFETVAPRRSGEIAGSTPGALAVDIDGRDARFGTALRRHKGYDARAGTYVEHAALRCFERTPCAEQHAVGADLHGAPLLAYRESLEAEHGRSVTLSEIRRYRRRTAKSRNARGLRGQTRAAPP